MLPSRGSSGNPTAKKDYAYQQIPCRTVEVSGIDRVHKKRFGERTEETRDLRGQIKIPHCLQASEPPSGIDETTLEVAP